MSADQNFSLGNGPSGRAQDRRAHPRKPLRTSATLHVSNRSLPARTVDISREGIAVVTETNVAFGSEATVGFSLPTGGRGHAMLLRGRVVDVVLCGLDGFRISLSLGQLPTDEARLIDQFLAS